jgi:hypothetical protein
MRTSRLALIVCALLMAGTSAQARFPRGSAPYDGKTWNEALAKVPCPNVAKDGKDLKIDGTVIVDGKSFPNPVITEEDRIKPLDKRCFSKG